MSLCAIAGAAVPVRVRLAADSQALLPVVVSSQASDRVKMAAADLSTMLGLMADALFPIEIDDTPRGLAVGLVSDFPALKLSDLFAPDDPLRREEYLLRSHAGGLYLIGATELAVEHAVWDLLYRLGYRQFFPGPHWEIVPRLAGMSIAIDAFEKPDYHSRRIWYGYGAWEENRPSYDDWCTRNRATAGLVLNTGHAYETIRRRYEAEFRAHPEWLGLVKGERISDKFCISNPELRGLVVNHCLKQLEENPALDSVSCEPSDGGGWCECAECAKLGTPSDRALFLANTVAAAIQEKFPGKLVGMYAYNEHSPPPHVKVHPQVIVSVATAFFRGGYTLDELVTGWQKQGATLGIREYYGVNVWDRDLPGAARGGNLEYLRQTIPDFHARGARFLSAEASDNWGPNGLGYYLAARMLWDVDEASRQQALIDDFLGGAFGTAKQPMGEFYALLDGANSPLLTGDLVGQMYRKLQEARGLTTDAAIAARLDDLTLYVRYVELYRAYTEAKGEAHQAACEAVMRHAYHMRGTMMVHSLALWRDLPSRDKAVTVPPEAAWNKPEPGNPWKSGELFTREELDAMLQAGMAANALRGFETVSFSRHLMPATSLNLPQMPLGSAGIYGRNLQNYWTYFGAAPAELRLKVTGGMIAHYRDRGNVKIALLQVSDDGEVVVDRAEIPPDGNEREVVLRATKPGLHRLELSDGGDATKVTWPDGTPMTVAGGEQQPATLYGRWQMIFYVPKGTKIVGGYSTGGGQVCDASGTVLLGLPDGADYFSVPVPPGQDGTLWSFRQAQGQKRLLTVPAYLARNERELLLPVEVLQADGTAR